MAINVYTPGCHLLCHDDVIGSRRVSYILYLTDPDRPWKPEWGGALRLYPTIVHDTEQGKSVKVPSPDFSVAIPPAFNQLSFFAVQPGESFHDVEEVYAHKPGSGEDGDESRVRMAISGWYHIPQISEDGYVEGLEESLAEQSSLQQLQSSGDQFDRPLPRMQRYHAVDPEQPTSTEGTSLQSTQDEVLLSEDDLEFLLKYIAPTYLTPDTLESVSDTFSDECSICLEKFLSKKYSETLENYITCEESYNLPSTAHDIESTSAWKVARPPHKQRFLFQQNTGTNLKDDGEHSPIQDLLRTLLPSEAFRKWLQLATGMTLSSHNLCARRFRRGKDYTLATGYSGDESQLEIILATTPTSGWGANDDTDGAAGTTAGDEGSTGGKNGQVKETTINEAKGAEETSFGGYVAYMAGDDADDESDDDAGSDGVEVPLDLSTGARASKPSGQRIKPEKADPAVYKATAEDEDDGVLFSMPACWNTLGIVLRDKGVMRFVKYVSQQAPGDRWDIVGEFGVVPNDDDQASGSDEARALAIEHEESETEIESSEGDGDDDDDDE